MPFLERRSQTHHRDQLPGFVAEQFPRPSAHSDRTEVQFHPAPGLERRRIRALPPTPVQPQACVPSCFFLSSLRYPRLFLNRTGRGRVTSVWIIMDYYVAFSTLSPASIVDKTSFINQSAAILAPIIYQLHGTPY